MGVYRENLKTTSKKSWPVNRFANVEFDLNLTLASPFLLNTQQEITTAVVVLCITLSASILYVSIIMLLRMCASDR